MPSRNPESVMDIRDPYRQNHFLIVINFKEGLDTIGLNPKNSVVIGSGILSALNIRESEDIDVVVDEPTYVSLGFDPRFKKAENHGHEILVDSLFEIGAGWFVLNKDWKFNDLLKHSIIIDGVRYNTLQFLLDAKRSWLRTPDVRQKDKDDVKRMERYLSIKH
jgi:hypothetical protein